MVLCFDNNTPLSQAGGSSVQTRVRPEAVENAGRSRSRRNGVVIRDSWHGGVFVTGPGADSLIAGIRSQASPAPTRPWPQAETNSVQNILHNIVPVSNS